jgi:hypothetical protein
MRGAGVCHTPAACLRAASRVPAGAASPRPAQPTNPVPAALSAPAALRPQGVDAILESALTEDVAFLVVGDPFAATTHTDLQLRARCAPC